MLGLIGLTKIGPRIIDDDDDANLGVESNMWRRMRPQLTQPSSWAVAWSCSHRKRYFPIQHFSEIFFLQFGGYDVIGGEIYEKIKSKNCQAQINEKRNGPSLSHKTPIGETKAAPEAKQAANISRSNNFSFISLSNNPDLFLETLSPLFAFDFVGWITNQRWMLSTENISEIFDRKTISG